MKKILLSLVFIGTMVAAKAQNLVKPYKIDDIISLNMPGNVSVKEETAELPLKYYLSESGDTSYMVQLMEIYNEDSGIDNRPHDAESLKKYYSGIASGYAKKALTNGLTVIDSSFSTIGKYESFKVSMGVEGVKTIESQFLVLGDNVYTFLYINNITFDDKESDRFIKSIVISNDNPGQLAGGGPAYNLGYIFGQILFYILLAAGIVWLVRFSSRNSKKKRNMNQPNA